jgi:hypothetical protein
VMWAGAWALGGMDGAWVVDSILSLGRVVEQLTTPSATSKSRLVSITRDLRATCSLCQSLWKLTVEEVNHAAPDGGFGCKP